MPRIIFKCRYLKNSPKEHLSNLVEYVATREGVEKIVDSASFLPVTQNQKKLISEILQKLPDTADLFEYVDYLKNQTRENALEFISIALESNLDLIGKKKNFVDYIANRPRVEKLSSHGLFTDDGVPVVLSQVAEEVSNHPGNVWTNIISLRREDAARLGYDCAKSWQDLIRAQRNVIAGNMKIAPENLRWYAAFHNESHHPHIHLIAYSINPKEAYVTKQGIENMRGSLAREIFRQDLMEIYEKQTECRDVLGKESHKATQNIIEQINSGICENKNIEELITHLAEKLKHTSGKKQYGYLKAPLKEVVDQIINELAKDERIAKLYSSWYEMRNEVLSTYADTLPLPLPLSQQKEFKNIKNWVISEALNIGSHHFTFEIEEKNETPVAPHDEKVDALFTLEVLLSDDEKPTDTDYGNKDFIADESCEDTSDNDIQESKYHVRWSDRYKEAREFLYGTDEMEPDFKESYRLFMEEAEIGNAYALFDLGRMHMDGIGVKIDLDSAQQWYTEALTAFMSVEAEKHNAYIQYRIGKMHYTGYGTQKDHIGAANWFHQSAAQKNKFAQYSLAGLHYHGQGVAQSYETGFDLYRQSALQGNAFASHELAKMYRDGIGTQKNMEGADEYFKKAFIGFITLEEQTKDDKLQYRLGQMLYIGTGIEKNIDVAIAYFEKAARLGNVNAQYKLGKIYLEADNEHENVEKALQWLGKAADNGNALAQYVLAKLYHAGIHVEKDIQKAVEWFIKSADQDNHYAAYQLGKLYLLDEDVPKNIDVAIKWLTVSAGQNNQFALYTLGKFYLEGKETEKDIPSAIRLLTGSAEQGNQFAEYQLGKLYLLGKDVPKDVEAAIKWFIASAKHKNQYAQYTLGKIYLLGHDVKRDKETAEHWLSESAAQGNIYAQFLLERMDSIKDPSVLLAATKLMHHLSNIARDEYRLTGGNSLLQVDRKLRKKLMEKKSAQGHASDDHIQQIY